MHCNTNELLLSVVLASVFTVGLAIPVSAQVKEPVWVYDPADLSFGPVVWGDILQPDGRKMFPTCSGGPLGQGNDQTPIDITDAEERRLRSISVKYRKTPLNVTNNFRNIQVRNANLRNRIVVDGEAFHLIELHFHTPSEHTVNGERFSMEGHFVHMNAHDQFAVLSILYKLGKRNRVLAKIFAHAPRDNGTFIAGENIVEGRFVNPRGLLPHRSQYFFYSPGSLTNPPCSEELLWFILKKPATVSQEQVDTYMKILTDVQEFSTNARPRQDKQNRMILEKRRGKGVSGLIKSK